MATKKTRTARTVPERTSVAAFLAALPDAQRRSDCEAVSRIMQAATGCEPVMWGTSIVGFDRYHYRYDSGREGDAPIVAFSPRSQAIVLYLQPGLETHGALLAKLGRHTTGKGCLYIKKVADVDTTVLDALVRGSVAATRERHPDRG